MAKDKDRQVQVQAQAMTLTLENDGLPAPDADIGLLGECLEHEVIVGKEAFNIRRFLDWQRKRDNFIKAKAQAEAQTITPGVLTCKVGSKGTVSVYGLNVNRPVSLYASQWKRLLADGGKFILDFIKTDPVEYYEGEGANTKRCPKDKPGARMVKLAYRDEADREDKEAPAHNIRTNPNRDAA